VSLGDLEKTTQNPQYQDKERLFLDANDIQKYAYRSSIVSTPFGKNLVNHLREPFADY